VADKYEFVIVLLLLLERLAAGISGRAPEFLFDAQQLVVLGDAVGAAGRAGLDLAAPVATARSAMKASSVSPERCDTMQV
jgi:hypothetical protein